jgi:hypothetical protein
VLASRLTPFSHSQDVQSRAAEELHDPDEGEEVNTRGATQELNRIVA